MGQTQPQATEKKLHPKNTLHTRKAARQQWEARAALVQCEREHI